MSKQYFRPSAPWILGIITIGLGLRLIFRHWHWSDFYFAASIAWMLLSLFLLPAIREVRFASVRFLLLTAFFGFGFWAITGIDSGSPMTWGAFFYGMFNSAFEVWDKDEKIVQTMPRERPQPEQVGR